MTLNILSSGEPWMTPHERDLNYHLIRDIAESLAAAGVHENALVALRVNDVAVTWLLARRLESVLTPTEGQPVPCPTPAQANAIGKCRERLRSAIKELEQCQTRTGAKTAPSLADCIYETMQMLEDSLPRIETTPPNTKTAQESETLPNNLSPTQNPPALPRQTTTREDCTLQTTPTTPYTTPAPRSAGRPHEKHRPHVSQSADARRNPKAFLTWTARAKAPPR